MVEFSPLCYFPEHVVSSVVPRLPVISSRQSGHVILRRPQAHPVINPVTGRAVHPVMNLWRARHRDALGPAAPAWKAVAVQPVSCFEHGPFLSLHLFAPDSRWQLGFRGTPHPGPLVLRHLPYDCPGAWLPETPSFSSRIYPMMCSSCPQLKPWPDPVIMNAVEGFSWWWLLFCCLVLSSPLFRS
ncbi:uncharacterized protein METZ01_LOCUS364851 [marine metagenome]|uniref:Uncharacterized protein n=1 Tax=marine metagenome TaxID=408172 RepID=A0A382SS20_9ZZZZ